MRWRYGFGIMYFIHETRNSLQKDTDRQGTLESNLGSYLIRCSASLLYYYTNNWNIVETIG